MSKSSPIFFSMLVLPVLGPTHKDIKGQTNPLAELTVIAPEKGDLLRRVPQVSLLGKPAVAPADDWARSENTQRPPTSKQPVLAALSSRPPIAGSWTRAGQLRLPTTELIPLAWDSRPMLIPTEIESQAVLVAPSSLQQDRKSLR